jgi:hypothetical protein
MWFINDTMSETRLEYLVSLIASLMDHLVLLIVWLITHMVSFIVLLNNEWDQMIH